jgi:GMP synthase-like glutamine amidotransferase
MSNLKEPRFLIICTQSRGVQKAHGTPEETDCYSPALQTSESIPVIWAIDQSYPEDLSQFDAIIIGGSAHSLTENLLWFSNLFTFLRRAAEEGKHLLGVCFGHQALAQCLGNVTVMPGENGREMGAIPLKLTPSGQTDPLFAGLDPNYPLLINTHTTWVPQVPAGWQLLAETNQYSNQSFACDLFPGIIRTLQPHPELTQHDLISIMRHRRHTFDLTDEEFETLVSDLAQKETKESSQKILMNFRRMVEARM